MGAGQISPRGVLLSIRKILVHTNMGFVSCNFIGQASFTWKPALSFCHFKSGGQEGDIEKQSKAVSSVTLSPRAEVNKIPDLNVLRQDMSVQALVDQRLKQLADAKKTGTKIKSLRGGSVEVLVPNCVKWPHEYVLSGLSKERVSYDHLSTTQWLAGFCRIMKEEQNLKIRDNMLDYMISLFDDANDLSWDAAKASHTVLLRRMEQGEVKDYSQIEKIDRIRHANAQRHNITTFGSCSHTKTHKTRGVLYKHVCAACHATGKSFGHPAVECRYKNKKLPKNE